MTLPAPDVVIAETQAWLELAVIGLNLCPFAKAVHAKKQIRWVATAVTDPSALLSLLTEELALLAASDAAQIDTTLIIHPAVLNDFLEFNAFLGKAEKALRRQRLEGTLQIASFHPQYQFAGTDADDVTNATNRSPYPTLHLLREDSVARAVAAFPQADAIYEANMRTLESLGADGWQALQARCKAQAAKP